MNNPTSSIPFTEELEFQIRNVHCETVSEYVSDANRKYYKPLPRDYKVPVIRMFGILDNGEKCLVNIHGILPYFFLKTRAPFTDSLKTHVGKVIVKCAQLLDYKLVHGYPLIADVIPVELKDMYGYYEKSDYFVKVLFYDPILCHRIGLTLQKECGKSESLQPYFTHIPYLLQFFIDYNIFGMGIVKAKNIKFRNFSFKTEEKWSNLTLSNIIPISNMDVEIDIHGDDIILNKTTSLQSEYQCSGLDSIWKEERLRCKLKKTTLDPPERPEIGVPIYFNKREGEYINKLKKIIKEMNGEMPTQLNQTQVFSQTDVESDKVTIEEYVKTQIIQKEIDELEKDDEEQEDIDPLEMTQVINRDENKKDDEDVIVINDEPEIINISDDEADIRCHMVAPDYPKVLVYPQDTSCPSTCSYPDVPTNETWCRDETYELPKMNKTIIFPRESPPKLTASQKLGSELFSDSMKLSSVHHLSVMAIEVLFMCNDAESFDSKSDKAFDKKFIPNPETDPVIGIFYSVYNDVCNQFQTSDMVGGVVIFGLNIPENDFKNLVIVQTEKDIFRYFSNLLKSINPDVIIGYDIKRLSLGYLIKRAYSIGSVFLENMSRLVRRKNEERMTIDDMKGRILLNVWKLVRSDHPMRRYRMSAVVSEVLNRRYSELSQYWIEKNLRNNDPNINGVILRHFLRMADLDVQILIALDIFIKTSQMARVYGIQFTEVLSRGSQFRVEAMLLRLSKDHGFCPPSVGVEQRNAMISPETMPLTLEPKSGLYYDPVVVLDFQSLYPSVCIAYNYCFTTCLGRVVEYNDISMMNQKIQLGALPYNIPDAGWLKEAVKNNLIHISPVGGIFVKKEVRKSLLAMMLEELLETRVMVKQSMKKYNDNVLNRLLDARQLALKLIANVTYGYTAANFSGRMPCAEVADAIVAKGREALERAIKLVDMDNVNGGKKYRGSRVIYGDTDSLFVLMPGLTKEEAFVIGKKIAADVTKMNPYPIKLKFEKVMMPCCLMAKKRYVGMSYENESDIEGKFDAKGIETVRRDACEFVSHVMEKVLRLLFQKNITGAMSYLKYKVENIKKVPLKHFILSGDYRVQYSDAAVVPMKKLAAELEELSPLHKPVYGERLEYIVVEPPMTYSNTTVYNCVFRLQKFLEHPELKVNYTYYITRKLIPALSRVFQLVPIQLNIHCANIDYCKSCGVAAYVFCNHCSRNLDNLVDMLFQSRKEEVVHKTCRDLCNECTLMDSRIRKNIPCYNVDCKIWQQRLKLQESGLDLEFERHKIAKRIERVPLDKLIIK